MRYKLLAATGIIVLILAFSAAAFADRPVALFVNGSLINSDVPPQLIDGRTMVPVRWVAEAFGAKVKWEEETNSVRVDTPELDSLQRQVQLLQKAVTPATPKEAVEKWTQGVKDRNGALQYAVLSPELKEQRFPYYESIGWVTGVSSPWCERYEITGETETGDGAWEYKVKIEWATSTGPAGASVSRVIAKSYGPDAVLPSLQPKQNWYISQIIDEDGLTEQLNNKVKGFLSRKYETHYRVLETQVSPMSQNIAASQVEAEFMTKITHMLGCETPAEWPPQKGRIKYLEENRKNLTPEEIKKVEEKISFWNQELQEYIDKPFEANEFLKITAEVDGMGIVKNDTVKIYYQDPVGKYLPVQEEDWPSFKTAEELVNQGYEEMRELVGKNAES